MYEGANLVEAFAWLLAAGCGAILVALAGAALARLLAGYLERRAERRFRAEVERLHREHGQRRAK